MNPMTDQQLQAWVEQISLVCFNRPFSHQARFNRRLTSTGGRYFTKTHDIEISQSQWDHFGSEEVERIIKHELCHYHLHILKMGFRHQDIDFKKLLKKVGGSRYCQSLPRSEGKGPTYRYRYICKDCQLEYLRKRKLDSRKYACGKCNGQLKEQVIDPLANSNT
jgi:SprT-like protein